MTPLDAGIIILFLIFLIRGIWIGLVRQIASIAALIFGFVAAGLYYEQIGNKLLPFIESPKICFFVTFIGLFLAVYLVIVALGFVFKKVMSLSLLGWFDRLMGGVFGVGKALFVSTFLFMILSGFLATSNPILTQSLFSPYLSTSSKFFLTFIKDKELHAFFQPKEPAISPLFPIPLESIQFIKPAGGSAKKVPKNNQLVEEGGTYNAKSTPPAP